MKKTLLLLGILCVAALKSSAQDNSSPKLSAGFDVGGVIGPASSTFEEAAGVSLKLEYPLTATPVYLTLTAAYSGYITKGGFSTGYYYSSYDGGGSYGYGDIASFVPVEAGARMFVSKKFFIEGDLGASLCLSSGYVNKKVALIYAPIAGISIPVRSSSVDVSLRYESRVEPGGNFSQIAVRAAFAFGL